MKLDTCWIDFEVDGVAAKGWLAKPARVHGPLPGVVVIQEAFGVGAYLRDVCERLAAAGYAAFAPDLFFHGGKPKALEEPRVEAVKDFLDSVPRTAWYDAAAREPELAKVIAAKRAELEETLKLVLNPNRPWAQYVATVTAGRRWLAENASQGRKVGALGFCLGGTLTLRMACADPELGAAVSFYGGSPPLEQVPQIRCPVQAHYADDDPRVNDGVPAFAEAMRRNGKSFEHFSYAGAPHAFMNDTRNKYHVEAARLGWARALLFLAERLGP